MLEGMILGGQSPEELADLAQGRLRTKKPALEEALAGRVGEHQRVMLSIRDLATLFSRPRVSRKVLETGSYIVSILVRYQYSSKEKAPMGLAISLFPKELTY
jgi:hypothetical protein